MLENIKLITWKTTIPTLIKLIRELRKRKTDIPHLVDSNGEYMLRINVPLTPYLVCNRDTDGDGNCGKPHCLSCGSVKGVIDIVLKKVNDTGFEFVEIEREGRSISLGKWVTRNDGNTAIRVTKEELLMIAETL